MGKIGRQCSTFRGKVRFEGMLGQCPRMQEVFDTIRRVAPSDVIVLVSGESGTGKELVARAVHERSARRCGPFVPVNCGAIPENLVECELFGHEKGAFTDASGEKSGVVQRADGGTLFLDEIGDLPLRLQPRLLRFIQEMRFTRVGGVEEIGVDLRIVAAGKKNLKTAMRRKTFREDLFYRLHQLHLELPPLRERGDDVFVLALHFLDRFRKMYRKEIDGFAPDALLALEAHRWPGNVRELENRVHSAVVMGENRILEAGDLSLGEDSRACPPIPEEEVVEPLRIARERAELRAIQKALAAHGGHLTRTAEALGITRPTLSHFLKKFGLKPPR